MVRVTYAERRVVGRTIWWKRTSAMKSRSIAVGNPTLDAVIDFGERSLVRELHFVR